MTNTLSNTTLDVMTASLRNQSRHLEELVGRLEQRTVSRHEVDQTLKAVETTIKRLRYTRLSPDRFAFPQPIDSEFPFYHPPVRRPVYLV